MGERGDAAGGDDRARVRFHILLRPQTNLELGSVSVQGPDRRLSAVYSLIEGT